MGIRDRIKRRLKGARELLKQVQEEANYPGRPQPHMAARNPLWGGAEDKPPEGAASRADVPPAPRAVKAAPDPYATNNVAPDNEDEYWFLKDNTVEDGWRETDPGKSGDEEGED